MFEFAVGLIIFVVVTMFLWKYTAWLVVLVFGLFFSIFLEGEETGIGCGGCMAGLYLIPCGYIGYIIAAEFVARLL